MALTRREVRERRLRVTTLTVRGLSPGEIAQVLHVPPETVYNDLRVIRSARNEALVAHSRKEMLAQLLLNARERTRELWNVIENADSDYVKLLALRELRIHDQAVLKNISLLSGALKPDIAERLGLPPAPPSVVREMEALSSTPELIVAGDGSAQTTSPAADGQPDSASPVHPAPDHTNVAEDPCESVNRIPKSMPEKELNLQGPGPESASETGAGGGVQPDIEREAPAPEREKGRDTERRTG